RHGCGRGGPRASFHRWAGNREPSSVGDVEGPSWVLARIALDAPPGQVQALLATSTIFPKVAASRIARAARILRSDSISAFLRPAMNWPYVRPFWRAAALIRTIHN